MGRAWRVVVLGLWEEKSEQVHRGMGLPATGFLGFKYIDNKDDKWSVTRLAAERKQGKEIGLDPSEENSTTHVLLQKDVMNSYESENSSYYFTSPIYLSVHKVQGAFYLQILCITPSNPRKDGSNQGLVPLGIWQEPIKKSVTSA